MRLRITRQLPPRFNGFETGHYQVDQTYDIGRALGELLMAHRFAIPAPVSSAGVAASGPGDRQTVRTANTLRQRVIR
jgi:hypothetical protein